MSNAFDNIGNRLTAEELAAETEYAANAETDADNAPVSLQAGLETI